MIATRVRKHILGIKAKQIARGARIILKGALEPYKRLVRDKLFPKGSAPKKRTKTEKMRDWTSANKHSVFYERHSKIDIVLFWRFAIDTGMRPGLNHRSTTCRREERKRARRSIRISQNLADMLEFQRGSSSAPVFPAFEIAEVSPDDGPRRRGRKTKLVLGSNMLDPRSTLRSLGSAQDRVNELEEINCREQLPYVDVHSLRHTSATILMERNVNPKIVQQRLDHSSVSITLDLYSHVTDSMEEDASALIGDVLRGKSGTRSGTKSKR